MIENSPDNSLNYSKGNELNVFAFIIGCFIYIWVFRGALNWLWIQGTHDGHTLNLFLLCISVTIALCQGFILYRKHQLFPTPQLNYTGVLLFGLSMLVHYLNQVFVQINIISTVTFFLGLAGFLFVYFQKNIAVRFILPIFTCISILPYAEHFNELFGFPVRIWIAQGLADIFQLAGVNMVSQYTILATEFASTNIDTACSGIKYVWATIVSYCAMSWIGEKRLTLLWFAGGIVCIGISILFNIIRILLLVLLSIFHWDRLESIVHIPFGIFLFIVSVVIMYMLLYKTRLFPAYQEQGSVDTLQIPRKSILFVNPVLLIPLLILSFVIHPEYSHPGKIKEIQFRDCGNYFFEPIDFSEGERRSHASYPIDGWCKKKFKADTFSGSLAIIRSPSWRVHHNPVRCLRGNGSILKDRGALHLNEKFSLNQIYIVTTDQFACYWFQNEQYGTYDYSQRLWLWITGKQKEWTMVSIVFDQAIDIQSESYIKFVKWLYSEVSYLQKERAS
jgi:exosortase O